MDRKPMTFESSFDIDRVSFDNVSKDFEKEFMRHYNHALNAMNRSEDRLTNASGANSLGILEKMAQHINEYNKKSDFNESYHQLLKEYEPFNET